MVSWFVEGLTVGFGWWAGCCCYGRLMLTGEVAGALGDGGNLGLENMFDLDVFCSEVCLIGWFGVIG